MSKAPKTYKAKVLAALVARKISHAEAVDCLVGDTVLIGGRILTVWGWERIYPNRAAVPGGGK